MRKRYSDGTTFGDTLLGLESKSGKMGWVCPDCEDSISVDPGEAVEHECGNPATWWATGPMIPVGKES